MGKHKKTQLNKKQIAKQKPKVQPPLPLAVMAGVVAAAVIVKFLLTGIHGHPADIGMSKFWSIDLARNGFNGFYPRNHVVYAPGYMYLLWISGKLALMFPVGNTALEFLVKFWAVMSDAAGGCLIYLIGRKYGKLRLGFLLGVVYMLNPAIFFNSSIWGQFDSIPATLLLGVVYCFNLNRNITAVILFAFAVLVKPQSGLLLPLVLVVFLKSFAWNKLVESLRKKDKVKALRFFKNLFAKIGLASLGGISAYIIVVMPFYSPKPYSAGNPVNMPFDLFYWLFDHYKKSLNDYPYATANGFNIWTILGGQTTNDAEPFMGLTYALWGIILVLAVAIFSSWLLLKKKNSVPALYTAAYFLMFGAFMFGSRMHERYLLPALIFLTVCILWDSRLWIYMLLLSVCYLANIWYVYHLSWGPNPWVSRYDTVALITAWITLGVMAFTVNGIIKLALGETKVKTAPGSIKG